LPESLRTVFKIAFVPRHGRKNLATLSIQGRVAIGPNTAGELFMHMTGRDGRATWFLDGEMGTMTMVLLLRRRLITIGDTTMRMTMDHRESLAKGQESLAKGQESQAKGQNRAKGPESLVKAQESLVKAQGNPVKEKTNRTCGSGFPIATHGMIIMPGADGTNHPAMTIGVHRIGVVLQPKKTMIHGVVTTTTMTITSPTVGNPTVTLDTTNLTPTDRLDGPAMDTILERT
jgi:hypothetical protein